MFNKETYQKRRDALRKEFKDGILFFYGNDESPMNYADNPFPFRQDSTFLYYFALDKPELYAVMDIDEGKDYIFGDDFTVEDFVWMGYQPPIKEQSKAAGIENTGNIKELTELLEKAKKQGRNIRFLPPYRAEHELKLLRLLGLAPDQSQEKASIEMIKAIGEQRNIKSDEEIAEIEKAVNISVDMHLAAMHTARPGMKEYEVMAKVHEVAHRNGGNISFPIIATIHGEFLHNHYHGNTIQSGNLFLLDAGAETGMHYAGDLSSTFPVDPKFTQAQKDIYQVAFKAHEGAMKALKPGKNFMEVHLEAARNLAEGMKDLGFMKGNVNDAVEAGAHALFFPCGLGHLMGMDAHDMENLGEQYVGYAGKPKSKQFGLKSVRLGRPLKPGFVITIEPGVYFSPQLIDDWEAAKKHSDFINYDKVKEYKTFGGTRNEENVLITEDGYQILGKQKPKTLEQVEEEREKAFSGELTNRIS
ncbi:MAG: aminopeptidase P family protein [Bacteroidales bacterium]|nr:aminopeptidase P family protein [Bacteroidales bacterium]